MNAGFRHSRQSSGMMLRIVPLLLLLSLFATLSCRQQPAVITGHSTGTLPDTLKVATLYGPSSYFVFRDEQMGYDYHLVKRLGRDKGMEIELTVAYSLSSMMEMLDDGQIDLIAYEVPVTAEYQTVAIACGPENSTSQVLVQPKGRNVITDVTELAGKDVYVEKDSRYQFRLQNLNEEIGGGINIHPIDRDTISGEDLIKMVSSGDLPLTVVDSDVARLNQTYYRNLDVTVPVSFPQRTRWAVSKINQWLADTINAWIHETDPRKTSEALYRRYFEMSKQTGRRTFKLDLSTGHISEYDKLFRQYADSIGWDWRMLAMQGYVESRFDTTAVSWAGARGIMQIMPPTARAYGLEMSQITNPEANLATAVKIISHDEKVLKNYVADDKERLKFVLAAYNSGLGHVFDAISIARETGRDPQIWEGNVADALLLKSEPDIYNNKEICKHGYFRGRQTTEYVTNILQLYEEALTKISQ